MSSAQEFVLDSLGLSGPGFHGTMSDLAARLAAEVKKRSKAGELADLRVVVSGSEILFTVYGSSAEAESRLSSIVESVLSEAPYFLLSVVGEKFGKVVE